MFFYAFITLFFDISILGYFVVTRRGLSLKTMMNFLFYPKKTITPIH